MSAKQTNRAALVLRRAALSLMGLLLLVGAAALAINAHVVFSTRGLIRSAEEAANEKNVDCVLILGCYVRENGTPSDMLRDRLLTGISLYEKGAAPKILMSGDHGQKEYDEVNTMKAFAVEHGVTGEDVFMDHAGFSTYESLYRARDVFQCKKVLIVTQEYHLHRALYVARALGLEAYGVSADLDRYSGQAARDVREVLARNKDFFSCLFFPKPTYLGEAIPITSSGELTDDKPI